MYPTRGEDTRTRRENVAQAAGRKLRKLLGSDRGHHVAGCTSGGGYGGQKSTWAGGLLRSTLEYDGYRGGVYKLYS